MKQYSPDPDEIAVYRLPRAYGYELNYYFGKELPEWTPENTSAAFVFFSANSISHLDQFHGFSIRNPGNTFSIVPATLDDKIWLKLGSRSAK